jgi:hypothetical protein
MVPTLILVAEDGAVEEAPSDARGSPAVETEEDIDTVWLPRQADPEGQQPPGMQEAPAWQKLLPTSLQHTLPAGMHPRPHGVIVGPQEPETPLVVVAGVDLGVVDRVVGEARRRSTDGPTPQAMYEKVASTPKSRIAVEQNWLTLSLLQSGPV